MFEVEVQAAKNFVEQPYTISLKNRRPTYRVCKQTLTYSKQEKISVSSSKILPRSAVWLDVRKKWPKYTQNGGHKVATMSSFIQK